MERTFVMIKPDGVQRGLIGKVISRFESRGMKIVAMKLIHVTKELAEKHYAEHLGKDFYNDLVEYITSSPVVAMVIEGRDAIDQTRKLAGKTDPAKADPGSIRFDFGQDISMNIIHAADKKESAEREIKIYFPNDSEILDYDLDSHKWMFR